MFYSERDIADNFLNCTLIFCYLLCRSSGAAAAFRNPATDSTSDDQDDSNEDDESSQEGLYSFVYFYDSIV